MKLVCLALLAITVGSAQAPLGSVSSSIFDERGAPVVSARLSLRGEQLYLTRTTEQGTFRFPRVPAGTYTLAIDQAGFCKLEIAGIVLNAARATVAARGSVALSASVNGVTTWPTLAFHTNVRLDRRGSSRSRNWLGDSRFSDLPSTK